MPRRLPKERFHMVEPERSCSYLEEETAALEYRVYSSLAPEELEELICRGWRRFGTAIFRPKCPACSQCRPLRIDVKHFQPTKSQRRSLKKNQHVTVTLKNVQVTQQHIDLYNVWHRDMTDRRDWNLQQTNVFEYVEGFLGGDFPSLKELQYRVEDRLVGVGLIDLMPKSISSAYFYYDPEWRPLGPGTFSMMCEIELAKRRGLDHIYLGYWIAACPSMAYKNRFDPHEILEGWPRDNEKPEWLRVKG